MRKGQVGKIIIVILIVGVLAYVFWPSIQKLLTPDGDQNGNGPPEYKNDIITIETYSVSNTEPYEGSTVTIEFWIKNNGDREVEEVEVNFFDVPGFNVTSINCDGKLKDEQQYSIKERKKCDSSDLDVTVPLDIRMILLTLKTPEEIISPSQFTVSYYIRYNYSGYRKADIPIVDGITRQTPLSTFSQSKATYGPVLLEFESKVGRERIEDDRTIKEYWSRMNEPFEVKMSFKHVGSSGIGIIKPVNISKGNIKLDLNNSLVKKSPCNFVEQGGYLFSKKDVLVPDILICNFENSSYFKEPESLAVIHAEFNYTYEYIKTQTFTVKPMLEE